MNEKQCRAALAERSGGRCERCGRAYPPVTLHHRRKRSSLPKSRMWELSNCVALCGHGTSMNACHSWVESHPAEAEKTGWHIRPWLEPEEFPIFLRGKTWVKLSNGNSSYNYIDDKGE